MESNVADMTCAHCGNTWAFITEKPLWFAQFMVAWRIASHLESL